MDNGIKMLLKVVESLDWKWYQVSEGVYELTRYSPSGRDFGFSIEGNTVEELIKDIHERYEDFDVSEETYVWLDQFGHGKNGAPHDMEDVLKDSKDCKEMIYALYERLNK